MCGITGVFTLQSKDKIEKETLLSMANALTHRGPDDSGFYLDDHCGLGFRRLSIIDLKTGNQPITNEDKSVFLICNGEIFNYKELKTELQSKGHIFSTNTDVETLVHLYEEYGTNLLHKLNGQFAFAIYDKKAKALFLARDHVGIAPLFYTQINNLFIFASEIKAILKHPLVKREVDLTGLDQVFSFPGAISPRTIFKNISSVKPGHYITVGKNRLESREYWDMNYPQEEDIEKGKPESFYIEKLDELLQQSIRYRLMSDVPLGFYLSGGIDSSLIAALIRILSPNEKRHSFSIGFTDEEIDERKYQKIMSEQVDSEHHEAIFDWPDISQRLRDMVYHAETPLKESYNTCSMALSNLARTNGIKVVLTGEGSDELFGGYIGYRYDKLRTKQNSPNNLEMMMEQEIRENLWGDPDLHYERNQFEFRETKRAIYSKQLNDCFNDFDSVVMEPVDKSKLHGRHPLHKRAYLDFKLRLSDHLISDHGDRVAYANSVEARYPFLDINFIEFIKTIPPDYLVKGNQEKYILKKYSGKYLPESIVKREKFAFVAPGSPYLIKQNIEWINDMLSYERIRREGYFNPDTTERLKTNYRKDNFILNPTFDNDLLMIVLTFGIIKETFKFPDL